MPVFKYMQGDHQDNDISVMHRTHLYELINDNHHCRIIGIIADSGFGKSSLVQGYMAHEGKSSLWCVFNASDSITEMLDNVTSEINSNPSFNAIVFDNCGLVASEVEFANAIPDIMELAPNTTVFLIGTKLPELPFAVMRAKEQYFELTHDELSLTRHETEHYYNEYLGFDLGAHQIDLIYNKTYGWFISLQLISTYMRKNRLDNLDSLDLNFLSDITDINDYLSYSLFENQTPAMQKFLLEICPVTELDADIINELIGIDNAESFLSELKEYHGFAYTTHSTKKLKLHPLFRQYLYERYMSHSSSKCLEAHNKLIGIYEKKRNYTMAFSHAVACNNYTAAISLMTKISDRYNPIQLLGFIDGHLEEISPTLLFSTTTLFLQRCIPESLMIELIQPLTEAVTHELDSLRLANLQHRLGTIYWHLGNLQMAKDLLEKSLTNAEMLRNTEIMACNYQLLADYHLAAGDTTQALRAARNALYLSEQNNITGLQLHTLEVFSRIQLALDHIDQASDYIWQAIELAETDSYELFWLYAALSTIENREGKHEDAVTHATLAQQIVHGSICGYDISYTNWVLASALIGAGKIDEARAALNTAYQHSEFTVFIRVNILKTMISIENDPSTKDALTAELARTAYKYDYANFMNGAESGKPDAPLSASSKKHCITINTFDSFSISNNGIPIKIKRTSSLRLLQLLIVNRGRFITKDYIIDQLFPDSNVSAGSNNFNVALSVLRKTLDASAGLSDADKSSIIRERNRYQLNSDVVKIDAATFETRYMKLKKSLSSELSAWLELSALFNGPFMTDYPYESFITSERERLAAYQKDVILNIARAYVQQGNVNRALSYYGRLLEFDQYDEDIYYEILEMLLDNHALTKAQIIANQMRDCLEVEMGIPCSEQIQSMFDYYHKLENNKQA